MEKGTSRRQKLDLPENLKKLMLKYHQLKMLIEYSAQYLFTSIPPKIELDYLYVF